MPQQAHAYAYAFISNRPMSNTPGPLNIRIDKALTHHLWSSASSLAITIGPDGLLLLGATGPETPQLEHRIFQNAFAVDYHSGQLAVSHKKGITVYRNSPKMAPIHPEKPHVHDAYFSSLVTFHTGDCLIHDIVITPAGLVVANTRFSTVCLLDGRYNINPIWYPDFISMPAPEDRCHLNGIAIEGEKLAYATTFGPYDTEGGWRGMREFNGLLIDVQNKRNLVTGLSMPHSPRLHDGHLFVCESGHGAVHEVDRQTGEMRTVVRLPGLTRGLAFQDQTMFVGMSTQRGSSSLPALPIVQGGLPLMAGVSAVDLQSGALKGTLQILDPGREVLDVKVLPGIRNAGIEDVGDMEAFHAVEGPNSGHWIKSIAKKQN